MTYKENLVRSMEWLAKQKKSVFLGEGLLNAGRIYGTLTGVPNEKCLEFPIAENLIMGSAIGLAIEGWKPVVVFQRMDFMLIAADQIINHACLIPQMSGGQFTLPIIIRAIVGSRNPNFDVGLQHNHDFTEIFIKYIRTYRITKVGHTAQTIYKKAYNSCEPCLIVEDRDLYDSK